jgi:hypothetical protein
VCKQGDDSKREQGTNQDSDRLRYTQLALSQRKVLPPFKFAHSDRVDVYNIVSAGMRATMETLASMKACFGCVESDQ